MFATMDKHGEPSAKDLSPGKVKLLQRGPKFAVTSPKVPFTEYIVVTKQICDRLGENTDGVDCSEYYRKTKDVLQDYKNKHASHPNITKEEREAIKTLKEDDTGSPHCRQGGSHGCHGQELICR